MGKEKYSFRITPKEAIDKYSIGNTSNIALDEELSQKFTTEAVEKAKQLKAKHGTKYSDAYYLDYAKSLELQEAIGTSKEINKNRLAFCYFPELAVESLDGIGRIDEPPDSLRVLKIR
mgnify:CR=1 FL=1